MKKVEYQKDQLLGDCRFIKDIEPKGRHRYALFTCPVCAAEFSAKIDHIKSKAIRNCGCVLHRESHGDSNTRLYHIWEAIQQRCFNEKHVQYPLYGATGITVCDDWKTYSLFKQWALSSGYSETLTIDRINVYGNYDT